VKTHQSCRDVEWGRKTGGCALAGFQGGRFGARYHVSWCPYITCPVYTPYLPLAGSSTVCGLMGRIRRILIFGGGDTHTDATPMVKVERRLLTWYAQRLGRLVWASERLRLAWNTDRLGLSVDARV